MATDFWSAVKNPSVQGQKGGSTTTQTPQKWVFWNRDWVQFDPNNPDHKNLPQYDFGFNKPPDSLPYYAQDIASLLNQLSFPGAAGAATFNSMFLEPQRQKEIQDALKMLTPEQMRLWQQTLQGRMQDYNNQQIQNQAEQARGQGVDQGLQDAQMLKGQGFDPAAQTSAILKAHNQTLSHIAKTTAGANANLTDSINQNMQTDNPYVLAGQRMNLINGGMQPPSLNLPYLGGGEQQRQNGSFLNQLLNAGMNYFAGGGSVGGGRRRPIQSGGLGNGGSYDNQYNM